MHLCCSLIFFQRTFGWITYRGLSSHDGIFKYQRIIILLENLSTHDMYDYICNAHVLLAWPKQM